MNRGDIVMVCLDPTVGSEISKTRPCVVVSPEEMNEVLRTVVVVPVTSKYRGIPTRKLIKATPQSGLDVDSYAALDQIKTIDKVRVVRTRGRISGTELQDVCGTLCEMFAFE